MNFCNIHYSLDCGCGQVVSPPTPPTSVWVLVEVLTKAVQVSKQAAIEPIVGRMSIFQRPEVQQVTAAKIVGVYAHQSHALRYPRQEGAEYLLENREIEVLPPAPVAVSVQSHCIVCGVSWPTSYCKKCETARNQEMRERDMGVISEIVPVNV